MQCAVPHWHGITGELAQCNEKHCHSCLLRSARQPLIPVTREICFACNGKTSTRVFDLHVVIGWADHSSRNGDCLSVFANELFPSLRRVNANAQLTRQHRLTVTIAKYRLRVVVFYGWLQQKHSPSVLNDATRWGLATPRLKQERWKIIIFILSVDSVVHFMTE